MPDYPFYSQLARILNSHQARSVVVCGNVYDLFASDTGPADSGRYIPLIPFLCEKTQTRGIIRIVYELNGPIRVLDDRERLKTSWISWKAGMDPDTMLLRELRKKGPSESQHLAEEFERHMLECVGNPTLALEMLRQLTICSRDTSLYEDLLIFVEGTRSRRVRALL